MNSIQPDSSTRSEGYTQRNAGLLELKRWSKRLIRSKTGTIGFVIVVTVIFIALFAPFLAPHDPAKQNVASMSNPPAWVEGGDMTHLLGTDNLGRDMLSRIIYATPVSLLIGVSSVIIAGVIGVSVGLVAGYYGGLIDNVFMRIVDSFLAIPNILLALVIIGVLGTDMITLILVLGVTNWIVYARVIRGEVLSIKELEYVKAARSIGIKNNKILTKHLLPNVMSVFIVISTLTVATTIILESSLSFLGLGIQPPNLSWGLILSSGRDYISTSWWIAMFPGLAITITVLGLIFLGDWLRDVFDPRSTGTRR